jgi:hypothetical protein
MIMPAPRTAHPLLSVVAIRTTGSASDSRHDEVETCAAIADSAVNVAPADLAITHELTPLIGWPL